MVKKSLLGAVLLSLWAISLSYVYGLGGLAGMHAPSLVEESAQRALPLAGMLMRSGAPVCSEDPVGCGQVDPGERQAVSCEEFTTANATSRHAVLFVFGQSNSANAGRDRYVAGPDVLNFNYHDGKCYPAIDPLLGPNGEGGSVWGVLGDQLIAGQDYDKVLIVPLGIGGTAIDRWAPGGDLHARIKATTESLDRAGVAPTHVLWHQGESDSGANPTAPEVYTEKFKAMVAALRDYGIDAPVFPAIATRCNSEGNDGIRAAQRALPDTVEGVLPGADTDALVGKRFRHDDCHFNHVGMQYHAALWRDAIKAR